MNTTLITSKKMTEGQEKQLRRVVMDDGLFSLNLANEEAQCLMTNGDLLQEAIKKASREVFVKYLYADEEVKSDYTYPKEYKRKSIREQIEILLEYFPGLNATWALTKGQVWYDGLKNLAGWIEGPLVYVWWEVFHNYNATVEEVLSAVSKRHKNFLNYRVGKLGPEYLRQVEKTAGIEGKIKKNQPGDLIIVPSQAGLRWRGKSVRRGRVLYQQNEFGLGSVAEGCRALTHERFVRWEQLHADCAGDEYSPGADGGFSGAPRFYFYGGRVEFDAFSVGDADVDYGSASGVVPQ